MQTVAILGSIYLVRKRNCSGRSRKRKDCTLAKFQTIMFRIVPFNILISDLAGYTVLLAAFFVGIHFIAVVVVVNVKPEHWLFLRTLKGSQRFFDSRLMLIKVIAYLEFWTLDNYFYLSNLTWQSKFPNQSSRFIGSVLIRIMSSFILSNKWCLSCRVW